MKIRSHTGNMVEARVGMVVEYDLELPDGIERVYTVAEIQEPDFLIMTDEAEIMAHNCTMLSCPFMVGDEVQTKSDLTGDWQEESFTIETKSMLDEINSLPGEFRHSNPDLRSKGGV